MSRVHLPDAVADLISETAALQQAIMKTGAKGMNKDGPWPHYLSDRAE